GQRRYTSRDLPQAEEKLLLYELGRSLFTEKGYIEIGMDHFSSPQDSLYKSMLNGELHRNFMGYTHQYTPLLIGLGVSSISDIGIAYVQNIKDLESYHACLREGKLP